MPNALMPDTSSYADPNGNALLARGYDPNAAAQGTITTMQGVQNLQRGQVAMDQQYYDLHKAKFGSLMDAAKSIQLNPTQENTTNIVGLMQQAGLIDPATGTQFLTKIAGMGNDPKQIGAYAGNLVSTLNSQEQQLDAAYGKTATLNTGGATVGVNIRSPSAAGPGSMTQNAGPPIANTTTPEFDASKQTWKTPDGVEHQGTQQQYGQAVGAGAGGSGAGGGIFADIAAGRALPPAGSGPVGGQGGAPASPSPAPASAPLPSVRPPSAPMQAPGGGGSPSPQNAGLAGPAPGLAQAQSVDADASAKQFAGITASATNLPSMKATVSNMEAQLPLITTGPQAAAWNKVKSYANFATELAAGKDVFDPEAIKAQDEFHNNSVKLAQQQFQQLGGAGTDGQFASASGDVPNESLSNMSNASLLAMNKGLIDAQQARASAAQAWKEKNGPASYGQFVDYWNRTFSPRAFQFNYLSPADRGTMLASMSPQEKEQLKATYDIGVQNKWIAPQGARK